MARCVVAAEELPAKHSLSAHCAESSQTRPFSYYFLSVGDTHSKASVYQEKWAMLGEEENRTGGERGQERGMEEGGGRGRGGLLEPGRGHGIPVEGNSEKTSVIFTAGSHVIESFKIQIQS